MDDRNLSPRDLQGCVNDVYEIKEFLDKQEDRFGRLRIRTLTSSRPSDVNKPSEREHQKPTFVNVQHEFAEIIEKANKGDYFLFHYSGHGARLPSTRRPGSSDTDPSLLMMDYFEGKQALRGWVLNEWLQNLNEKGVHILVTLDSCHAGDAWRGENSRSLGFIETPNLPSEIDHEVKQLPGRSSRNPNQETSWSINPDHFTVMTACDSEETTSEKVLGREKKMQGIFTYELLKHLNDGGIDLPYRSIRDHVEGKIREHKRGQTPKLHGQSTLLFFEGTEPTTLHITRCTARLENGKVMLPLGCAQGVTEQTQFMLPSSIDTTILEVTNVFDFLCEASIQQGSFHGGDAILSRWSVPEHLKQIYFDSNHSDAFQEMFRDRLRNAMVGNFNLSSLDAGSSLSDGLMFMKAEHGFINIRCPEEWGGFKGPIWRLKARDDQGETLTQEAAIAATSLVRYAQIRELRRSDPGLENTFDVRVNDVGPGEVLRVIDGQPVCLEYRNTGSMTLFVCIVFLGPGFCISQIVPNNDGAEELLPGQSRDVEFTMEIPKELKDVDQFARHEYRDIIRAIVTTRSSHSFKSLTMPEIWDAIQGRRTLFDKTRNLVKKEAPQPDEKWFTTDITVQIKSKNAELKVLRENTWVESSDGACKLQSVKLSPDAQELIGTVSVHKLAYEKQVICCYTVNDWKNQSEAKARYESQFTIDDIEYDVFKFNFDLAGLVHDQPCALSLCIRYTVGGKEHWDNNGGHNYQYLMQQKR